MIHEFEVDTDQHDEILTYEELEKVVDKELEEVFETNGECNPSFYHYVLASMQPGESVVLNDHTKNFKITKNEIKV